MYLLTIKKSVLDRENRVYLLAILLSIMVHVIMLIMIYANDLFLIDLTPELDKIPEPVTILFPENKPKQVVENINENDFIPNNADYLSDRNSQARNNKLLQDKNDQPISKGNVPFANLTQPNISSPVLNNAHNKKFTRDALASNDALFSGSTLQNETGENEQQQLLNQHMSTDNIYNQEKFSSDKLGDLSLSTYAWEWAPYLNAFKRKLRSVWFPPAAFYMGLIQGHTVVKFSISKDGQLLDLEVLEQKGHKSLEISSVNAIKSVFPFKKLPANFPDDKLEITGQLSYILQLGGDK